YRLLDKKVRVKVSNEPFYAGGKKFDRGSVMVSADNQEITPDQIRALITEITEQDAIDVYAVNTGLDYKGVSLGSSSFYALEKPTIAVLVEGGVSPTDAGEIWHLLDTRFQIPVTLLPTSVFNSASLEKYTTLIFPEGSYQAISESGKEKLKSWVQAGGVLIGFERALSWFTANGFGKFDVKKEEEKKEVKPRSYADINEDFGAQATSGAIFEADADLTHPILYGYTNAKVPLFKGNNIFIQKATGAYSNPLSYGNNPLLSGYITKPNLEKLKNTSVLGTASLGRGRVIGFSENMAFRAFWFGTNRMLMNAIFLGPMISPQASR
ncbi:MAG: zinc carboxypeptidase, partial [Cyclobacteriaceae bacterium]|nr:zinc carboxypeptidase [Cyclobacteriaceae bacterium]